MDLTPEELARRKMELRPSQKPEPKEPEGAPKPGTTPKLEPASALTPEQQAKKALGLQPHDPMPDPKDLSPQMREQLSKLDPKFQVQVMGVMGCLQHMQEKTQALSEKIRQNMGTAVERTRQTSLAQRAIIRRAEKGTLGQQDLELARGIIEQQGRKGAIDPKQEGLTELLVQREELMGAAKDMHQILMQQMPQGGAEMDDHARAVGFVDLMVSQQAATTSNAVDNAWSGYKQSDIQRIQAIMDGQKAAQVDQSATHRPRGR